MAILKKTAKAEQAVAETAVKSPVVEQAPRRREGGEARFQDYPEGFREEGPRGEEGCHP